MPEGGESKEESHLLSTEHREGHGTAERVRVGERFPLFALERTKQGVVMPGIGFDGLPKFESRVLLATDGLLPDLPVTVETIPGAPYENQAIAPFAPELSYHVTNEDFDPKAREAKVYGPEYVNARPIRGMPHELGVFIERQDLEPLGLVEERQGTYGPFWRHLPEVHDTLSRLELHALFPNGLRFAHRPDIGNGTVIYMDSFFPFDTGPLAQPTEGWPPGISIALPADLGLLSQIEGRFVLR